MSARIRKIPRSNRRYRKTCDHYGRARSWSFDAGPVHRGVAHWRHGGGTRVVLGRVLVASHADGNFALRAEIHSWRAGPRYFDQGQGRGGMDIEQTRRMRVMTPHRENRRQRTRAGTRVERLRLDSERRSR